MLQTVIMFYYQSYTALQRHLLLLLDLRYLVINVLVGCGCSFVCVGLCVSVSVFDDFVNYAKEKHKFSFWNQCFHFEQLCSFSNLILFEQSFNLFANFIQRNALEINFVLFVWIVSLLHTIPKEKPKNRKWKITKYGKSFILTYIF